jgi:ABC-type uncharacterized transport system substrate-binding protein
MFERSASRFLPARALAASALILVAGLGACGKGDAGKAAADSTAAMAAAPKPKTVAIIRAADWIGSEWSEDAIKVGLQEAGLEPGRDFVFTISSAQGDLATLPNLIDAALDAKADVIVALQDETLKSAVERVKNTPVVFNVLSDPFAAGAGTSDSSHLPNITGVYSPGLGDPEQRARVALIQKVAPNAKRVGVLFSPLEPLAVSMKDKLTASAKAAGLTVVAVPISSPTEGSEATTALIAKKVGAIEIYGNSAHAAFESIIKVAKENKVPVFSPSPFEVVKGATAAFFPDFQEGGVVAGGMIAKALKGESLSTVPFYKLEKTKTSIAGEAPAAAAAAPAQ